MGKKWAVLKDFCLWYQLKDELVHFDLNQQAVSNWEQFGGKFTNGIVLREQ